MRLREEVFCCGPIKKGFTPELPSGSSLMPPILQEERLAWHHSLAFPSSALNMLDGKIIGDCMPRHRHQEFTRFVKKIDAETPSTSQPHQILNKDRKQKHPRVQSRFRRNPRFHVHFTQASSFWLNMVVETHNQKPQLFISSSRGLSPFLSLGCPWEKGSLVHQ
jgi:hypothetical protein